MNSVELNCTNTERQKGRKTKRQKDRKTERRKDRKTKIQKDEKTKDMIVWLQVVTGW